MDLVKSTYLSPKHKIWNTLHWIWKSLKRSFIVVWVWVWRWWNYWFWSTCLLKGIKIAKYRFVIFSLCLCCCPFITAPTMPIKKIAIDICLLPVSPRPWCVGVGLHYTNPIIATASHHRRDPLCLLQILLGETVEKRGNPFD